MIKSIKRAPVITLYYIANLVDMVMSLWAIQQGYAQEGNALMRTVMTIPWLFILIKAGLPILVCYMLKKAPLSIQLLCAGIQVGIVIWNVILLFFIA